MANTTKTTKNPRTPKVSTSELQQELDDLRVKHQALQDELGAALEEGQQRIALSHAVGWGLHALAHQGRATLELAADSCRVVIQQQSFLEKFQQVIDTIDANDAEKLRSLRDTLKETLSQIRTVDEQNHATFVAMADLTGRERLAAHFDYYTHLDSASFPKDVTLPAMFEKIAEIVKSDQPIPDRIPTDSDTLFNKLLPHVVALRDEDLARIDGILVLEVGDRKWVLNCKALPVTLSNELPSSSEYESETCSIRLTEEALGKVLENPSTVLELMTAGDIQITGEKTIAMRMRVFSEMLHSQNLRASHLMPRRA